MRVVDRFEEETESTLELLDDGFRKCGEINVRVRIVEEFGKLCNAFCVCVGFKLEAFSFEESLEFFVVGDDAIVDDSKLPLRVRSVEVSRAIPSKPICLALTCEDGSSIWRVGRE